MEDSVVAILRRNLLLWGFALLLPMPVLLGAGPAVAGDTAVFYLAAGAALLAGELFRTGAGQDAARKRTRFFALAIAVGLDAVAFAFLGVLGQVESNIPLWLLATLSVLPAIGMVPWLTLRLGQPYAAIVVTGCIAFLVKLGACVVARIVYGRDFLALGYVAGDWRTAKLMISLFWCGIVGLSLLGLVDCLRRSAVRYEEQEG